MLICKILLMYTFFHTSTPKDLSATNEVRLQFPQPPIPLNSYPYQEDLTSTVQFLKEEPSNKKNKVGTLIKLLKKVLTKYIDILKETEEKVDWIETEDLQDIKKELLKEKNTTFEKKEQKALKKFKDYDAIIREVDCVKNMENVYEMNKSMYDSQKTEDNNHEVSNSEEGSIETTVISIEDFINDDPLNYMHKFRSKPIRYRNQQESYVLERPEPKMKEASYKQSNLYSQRNPKIVVKNNQGKRMKKQPFFIPCVKASDILDDTQEYVPKGAYRKDNTRPKGNTDVKEIQTTLENPLSNYVTCSDSDDTVAMLFKPKTISLMQAYGNLLKKITVTVLVPYHVTKLVL